MSDAETPYADLSPDAILDALESAAHDHDPARPSAASDW